MSAPPIEFPGGVEALFDPRHVFPRKLASLFGFLLKGIENVDAHSQLRHIDGTEGIRVMIDTQLEDTAFEKSGVSPF
jgi:hypothetical protein